MKKYAFTFLALLILTLTACSDPLTAPEKLGSPKSATEVVKVVSQYQTAAAQKATPTPSALPPYPTAEEESLEAEAAPTSLVEAEAATSTAAAAEVTGDLTATATPASDVVAMAVAETSSATEDVQMSTDYEEAVSIPMQLLLGTLKLDGDWVVTQEQAAALLPLWTEYQTLSQSAMPQQGMGAPPAAQSTPVPNDDLDTLLEEIMEVMTAEQIEAINEMQITQEIAMTMLEELGIPMGGGPQGGGGMPGGGQFPQGTPPAGGMPGGGGQLPQGTPPAGGMPGGEGQPPQGTPPSGGMPGGGQLGTPPGGGGFQDSGFIPPELIEALIELLEAKSTGA